MSTEYGPMEMNLGFSPILNCEKPSGLQLLIGNYNDFNLKNDFPFMADAKIFLYNLLRKLRKNGKPSSKIPLDNYFGTGSGAYGNVPYVIKKK